MANWSSIISFENIVIFLIGFLIGRFWRLGKKIAKQLKETSNQDG